MVTHTCALCGEYRRSKHMHIKKSTAFIEEYMHIFGSQKDEGPMCNSCYSVMNYLRKDHNLVSICFPPMSAYPLSSKITNIIIIFIYNVVVVLFQIIIDNRYASTYQ
jgi:hypothetical protein